MRYPPKLNLAYLPTPIEPLKKLSTLVNGPDLYIKRDDLTGVEVSGNKARKLEFALQEALDQGADTVITTGAIQSNHARATAAAASRLGLKCILLLISDPSPELQGNYLLDALLGAEIRLIPKEQWQERDRIMADIKDDLHIKGHQGYIIPTGASYGIGNLGYCKALEEIEHQETALGFTFDAIVSTVGSGGTYAGLWYANKVLNRSTEIIGINIAPNVKWYRKTIARLIEETAHYTGITLEAHPNDFTLWDGYCGAGYAKSMPEVKRLIQDVAALEGIILDPVYTGKAFYGLLEEIKKGAFQKNQKILFIHTGGLYGLFGKAHEFAEEA